MDGSSARESDGGESLAMCSGCCERNDADAVGCDTKMLQTIETAAAIVAIVYGRRLRECKDYHCRLVGARQSRRGRESLPLMACERDDGVGIRDGPADDQQGPSDSQPDTERGQEREDRGNSLGA